MSGIARAGRPDDERGKKPVKTVMIGFAKALPSRFRQASAATAASLRRNYSPSNLLIGVVVVAGVLLLSSSVVASYHGVNVVASLSFLPDDGHCPDDNPVATGIGNHCFSDYYQVVGFTQSDDPWSDRRSNYSAAGMLPNLVTGWIGDLAGSPRVGLIWFLALLTAALVTPAAWASKNKSLTPRLMALSAFGILTIPALSALDRGNSAALAVPALLAFLVAIRRGKFTAAVVWISVAALVRPQFLILIAVLWALRKWRLSAIALVSVGVSNLIAYAAWPKAFPQTLIESVIAVTRYGRQYSMAADYPPNVSLGKGYYDIHEAVFGGFGLFGEAPGGGRIAHYGGVAAFAVATVVILLVIALGPRLPVLLSASLVLVSATLFPGATWSYSLSSCLAIAAVLLRDPLDASPDRDQWRGALDGVAKNRIQVAAIGLFVLATAASLTRILLPHIITLDPVTFPGGQVIASTSASLAPVLWILASFAVIAAWRTSRPQDASSAVEPDVSIGSEQAATPRLSTGAA